MDGPDTGRTISWGEVFPGKGDSSEGEERRGQGQGESVYELVWISGLPRDHEQWI